MSQMSEFEARAVVDSVNRMFKSNFFYICTVDKCMALTGATRTKDYNALHLYHCVGFDKMSEDVKRFVFKATMDNITNVDSFPEIRLVDPGEQLAEQLRLEKLNQTPLLKRIFG